MDQNFPIAVSRNLAKYSIYSQTTGFPIASQMKLGQLGQNNVHEKAFAHKLSNNIVTSAKLCGQLRR